MASRQGQQLSVLRSSGGGLTSYRTGRGSRKYTPYESDCGLQIASAGKRKRLWTPGNEEDDQSLVFHPQEVVHPAVPSLIPTPEVSCGSSVPPHPEVILSQQISENVVRPVGMFGVVFPNRSFPMDASKFLQVDPCHWLLDMTMIVGEGYEDVKEMCIFLLNEFSLPADKALAVYVQSPGTDFQYRGAVHASTPSAVLSLLWPKPGVGGQMQLTGVDCPPLTAKIGLSVEDTVSLPVANVGLHSRVEAMALKVGENLFNFMQSFCHVESDKLVVPMDILDRWFKKFQDRAKKDSEYLLRFSV